MCFSNGFERGLLAEGRAAAGLRCCLNVALHIKGHTALPHVGTRLLASPIPKGTGAGGEGCKRSLRWSRQLGTEGHSATHGDP